ncbi:MAG: hypothetical protein R2758_08240 [Bacteroidales bacterium]
MPAPKTDEEERRSEETAQLAFSDTWLEGKGFTPWKSYSHPTLGEVEIGDLPPSVTIPRRSAWLILCWTCSFLCLRTGQKSFPALPLQESDRQGGGVYQLRAWWPMKKFLPFPTAMGKRNRAPAPAILILEGDGTEILSGKKRTTLNDIGGMKSARYVWLVRSAEERYADPQARVKTGRQ